MFGIENPWIWSGYLLCILSSVLCVVYGILNWNRGDEPLEQEDVQWAKEEKELEDELAG